MVSEEDLLKDSMWFEAVDRLELMGADSKDRWMILMNRGLDLKIVVNHEEKSIRRQEITDEELKMIKKCEMKYDFICYYLIEDQGMWPDGCSFKRYTLLFVDKDKDSYEMVKEECIKQFGTVPAYVINMEDESCSEITEIKFENVKGNILNAS